MTLADQARRIPGVAAAENALTGVLTNEHDLPIADYDKQSADEIITKLPTVSQHELRMIAAYEAKHAKRATVADRITTLTGIEPWPGYDAQNIADITTTLADHDADSVREVSSYELRHKDRAGVRAAVASHIAGE